MAAHYVTLRWKLFQVRGSPAEQKAHSSSID